MNEANDLKQYLLTDTYFMEKYFRMQHLMNPNQLFRQDFDGHDNVDLRKYMNVTDEIKFSEHSVLTQYFIEYLIELHLNSDPAKIPDLLIELVNLKLIDSSRYDSF